MFKNHSGTRLPKAVFLLIGLNSLLYLMQPSREKGMSKTQSLRGALIPSELTRNPRENAGTVVSSMFTHANLSHLLFNMLALYQFGRPLENVYGFWKTLLIYFGSGVGANLMYTLTHTEQNIGLVGASGAISGVMSAYFLEFLETKDMTQWLLFQVGGALLASQSEISYSSHIWGFIFGAILFGLLTPSASMTKEN